jgi:hypothetical protein
MAKHPLRTTKVRKVARSKEMEVRDHSRVSIEHRSLLGMLQKLDRSGVSGWIGRKR